MVCNKCGNNEYIGPAIFYISILFGFASTISYLFICIDKCNDLFNEPPLIIIMPLSIGIFVYTVIISTYHRYLSHK